MASKASAVWTGSLKEGKGTISTATGVLNNANYSFATRFEGADSGTTPEELIAAATRAASPWRWAHNWAARALRRTRLRPTQPSRWPRSTTASRSPRSPSPPLPAFPASARKHFEKAAAGAKAGCPISKLFANNTEITLDAKLV